ncbi:MAG: hypothetical protein A2202_00475 [Bdellovibrionales bacterium RIFOXYA1_FULL_36_14]|nr:MAG: hypothetical protein A2202_00475 [Bdellovibrionales bacterium RIFOXYA1_FULL_36_14]
MPFQLNFTHSNLFQWFVLFCFFFAFLFLAKKLIILNLAHVFKKTRTIIDDLFIEGLKSVHLIYLIIISMYAASVLLNLQNNYFKILKQVFILATIIQAGVSGSKMVNSWMDLLFKDQTKTLFVSSTSLGLFKTMVRVGFYTCIFIIFLHSLGVNVTTLIAGLGVGGIAIALALQNILGDLFASLTIILDRPFSVGDFISVSNYMGTIEYVGIKNTRIRSLSGEQIIVANGALLKEQIKNFKMMKERRVIFNIGVTYQTDEEKMNQVPSIIKNIIENIPSARFERCHFLKFGASSLEFEVVYWVENPDYKFYADIAHEINLQILLKFKETKIEFAYPSQTLFVRSLS